MDLFYKFSIEIARRLPHVSAEHKCGRVHGHRFDVEIFVTGELDPSTGWVIDFAELEDACTAAQQTLDHRYLNDIDGLENPTTEILAVWLWRQITGSVPQLSKVVVHENEHVGCVYYGPVGTA